MGMRSYVAQCQAVSGAVKLTQVASTKGNKCRINDIRDLQGFMLYIRDSQFIMEKV